MAEARGLTLYHFDECPHCARVRSWIEGKPVEVEMRDVRRDADAGGELVEGTGRTQVPCLRIEEPSGEVRWVHESLDIIRYLDEHVLS
jgi:glutaredoxin 2